MVSGCDIDRNKISKGEDSLDEIISRVRGDVGTTMEYITGNSKNERILMREGLDEMLQLVESMIELIDFDFVGVIIGRDMNIGDGEDVVDMFVFGERKIEGSHG